MFFYITFFVIFCIFLIFGNFFGGLLSRFWVLIASNPFGAIILTFAVLLFFLMIMNNLIRGRRYWEN